MSFIGPLMAMFDSSRLPEIVRSLPHCLRLHCVSRFVCASSHRSSIGICSTRTSRCAPPLRAACSPRVGRPFATGPWTSHPKRCAPAHHSVHSRHSVHSHALITPISPCTPGKSLPSPLQLGQGRRTASAHLRHRCVHVVRARVWRVLSHVPTHEFVLTWAYPSRPVCDLHRRRDGRLGHRDGLAGSLLPAPEGGTAVVRQVHQRAVRIAIVWSY